MAKLKRTMSCGCIVGLDYDGTLATYYCPKHNAAPDMYEALKLYQEHQEGTSGHYCWKSYETINKALAKAEGKL